MTRQDDDELDLWAIPVTDPSPLNGHRPEPEDLVAFLARLGPIKLQACIKAFHDFEQMMAKVEALRDTWEANE